MKKLNVFLGERGTVIAESDYCFAASLCILGSFLKVKEQNGKFFGMLRFQIFFSTPDIPDIYIRWGSKCRVQAYVARKMRVPPSPMGWVSA